jgi:hypothetical protein
MLPQEEAIRIAESLSVVVPAPAGSLPPASGSAAPAAPMIPVTATPLP